MERATREAMDPNLRHKPRLLSEEELPSWLLKDEDEVRKLLHAKFMSKIGFHNIARMTPTTKLTKSIYNTKY